MYKITVNQEWFKDLMIELLDTQNGIPVNAYSLIARMGRESDDTAICAILDRVKASEGYYYLPEDWKETFPKGLL